MTNLRWVNGQSMVTQEQRNTFEARVLAQFCHVAPQPATQLIIAKHSNTLKLVKGRIS
jgi:hypothetical protein